MGAGRLPDQIVGDFESGVVGLVLGAEVGGPGAFGLAVVEDDEVGVAFAHLVAGHAREQFVAVVEAGDDQGAGGDLFALVVIDQQGADGAVGREPVFAFAGARIVGGGSVRDPGR